MSKVGQASNAGSPFPVVDQTGWRREVNERKIKFDDIQKAVFLDVYRRTGMIGGGAKAAGVSTTCVRNHIKLDPDFAEAMEEAYRERQTFVVEELERQALDGHEEVIETEKGKRTRKVYESGIRLAMLKKYDPDGYREKNQLDVNMKGGGGVLVIPMLLSEEQWMAVYSPKKTDEDTAQIESEADEARRTAEDAEVLE